MHNISISWNVFKELWTIMDYWFMNNVDIYKLAYFLSYFIENVSKVHWTGVSTSPYLDLDGQKMRAWTHWVMLCNLRNEQLGKLSKCVYNILEIKHHVI